MQRLSGVLMVLAGTALGGYMVLPAPTNSAGNLAEVTRISAAPDRTANAADTKSLDMSSLVTRVLAQAAPAGSTTAAAAEAAAAGKDPAEKSAAAASPASRVFSPSAPLQAAAPASTSTWTAVVTSEPTQQGKLSSSKPGDAQTRAVLASDLQRELKRVGCYAGDVTGTWTPSSKRAMSAFMERVNATLPVEEPDYILLTLVQGHAAIACSAECPAGQVPATSGANAGRCVPQGVVAAATRKSQREEDRRAAEVRKAQQQERLAEEQRAADAARLAEARKSADAARLAEAARVKAADAARLAAITPPAPKPAVRPAVPQSAPQQTAAAAPEQLPWLNDTDSKQQATAPQRVTPLPGMMSVGGPRMVTPEMPASVAAVSPERSVKPLIAVTPDDRLLTPAGEALRSDSAPATLKPAVRAAPRIPAPVRHAAIAGLPGSKSGVAVAGMPGTKSGAAVHSSIVRNPAPQQAYKYRAAKIVRRPPPVVVYTPKPAKTYSYASSSGGKTRRGQPRPGSMHFNVMQSLGGIY